MNYVYIAHIDLMIIHFFRQVTSQDQIQELFTKHGTVNNFKWISKEGNKMALIELSSLEEAVLALIVIALTEFFALFSCFSSFNFFCLVLRIFTTIN